MFRPELAPLYEVPLLTKDQEQHLFRKMNYLKYKASRLRDDLTKDGGRSPMWTRRGPDPELKEIEELQQQANEVKD